MAAREFRDPSRKLRDRRAINDETETMMTFRNVMIVSAILAGLAPAFGQSSKTISITLKNGDGGDVMLSVTDKVAGREIYHSVMKGNGDTSTKVSLDSSGKSDLVWKAQSASSGKCRTAELKQLSDGQRVSFSADFSGYGNAC
jgi:hypothetical protein